MIEKSGLAPEQDDILQRLSIDLLKDLEFNNKSVFHFTTVSGLFSIITNNMLRLTNSRYMNDREEFLNYIKTTREVINQLGEDNVNDLVKWLRDFYKKDEDEFNSDNEVSHLSYYIFSTCKDYKKIPMWNYYSRGEGVCIEFDTAGLDSLFKEILDDKDKFHKFKCIYSKKDKKDKISNILDRAFSEIKFSELTIFHLRNSLLKIGYSFKEDIFEYEEELRYLISINSEAIYTDKMRPCFNQDNNSSCYYIDFYNTETSIRPCLKIQIDKNKLLPIKKIYISPTNSSETIGRGIKSLLNAYGYKNVDVKKYEAAIRSNY